MKKWLLLFSVLVLLGLLGSADGGESSRVAGVVDLASLVRGVVGNLTAATAEGVCPPNTHWVGYQIPIYFRSDLGSLGGHTSGGGGCQPILGQTQQAVQVRLDGGEAVWVARGDYQPPPSQPVTRLQPVVAAPTPTPPPVALPRRSETKSQPKSAGSATTLEVIPPLLSAWEIESGRVVWSESCGTVQVRFIDLTGGEIPPPSIASNEVCRFLADEGYRGPSFPITWEKGTWWQALCEVRGDEAHVRLNAQHPSVGYALNFSVAHDLCHMICNYNLGLVPWVAAGESCARSRDDNAMAAYQFARQ